MTNPKSTEVSQSGTKIWRIGTLTYGFSGLVSLFCWLLWGDFAYQMRDRALYPVFSWLLKNYGANDTFVASVTTSATAAIVITLTPIFSYWSDRHRGRLGRRIPFLFAIIPISVLAMVGLAYSPLLSQQHNVVLRFLAFFIVFFTASDTICNLIFLGLCNDVVPRALIGRFFGLFRMVSLIAGILFSFFLFGYVKQHFTIIVLCAAGVYGVGFTATCIMVREGQYPPPDDSAPTPWRATLTYLRECFSFSHYRWIFASIALANMAFIPFNTYLLLWAMQMGMDFKMYGEAQAAQMSLSLVLAYPLGWLVDRLDPIVLTIIAMVFYSSASLLSFHFVHTPFGLAAACVLIGASSGMWLTATNPFCMALFPKIDFAQFYAAASVISSIGCLITALACGRFLDHHNHNYRYIVLWNAVLGFFSLLATCVVYKKYLNLGGRKAYIAPVIPDLNDAG